ncbi:MAG TPA: GMC oxidoreductase [Candidatus Limnocylindria bacterium]|nr:GMC oxidoreductase [Candidatus Limnocylindria bacterium]
MTARGSGGDAALVGRVVPILDAILPGVADAGAARYTARWLAAASTAERAALRRTITALGRGARARYARPIAALDRASLDALIASLHAGELGVEPASFWSLRLLALEAAFADPRYGGNRGGWGWRLVGAVGDPQPRGFRPRELASAAPVAPAVTPSTRWTASLASRSRARSDDADVVVVGLGAAGGVIAAELAEAGLRVIALEAGRATVRASTDEREFQVRRALFWREPETLVVNDGPPLRGSWLSRNIGVGGPLHWTAITYRFHPSDFRVRSGSGHVAGTSLADWPVAYADLEPFYDRAEREIGVAGAAGANPYEGGRGGAFPLPPVPQTRAAARFADAARRLGYTPYPTPAAVLTERRASRLACNLCGRCSHYDCLRRAKGTTRDSVLARAARTGRLDIRPESRVERVLADPRTGLATGVRYRGPRGRREVTARTVVVANGAAYQARLLLLSTSRAHPRGLANSSGLVGRNLMFHTNVMAWGAFDELLYADRGPQTAAAFDDLDEDRPRERHGASFIRGAAVLGGIPLVFAGGPLAFANAAGQTAPLPDGVRPWGSGFRDFLAATYARHFGVFALCEDLPMEQNRIELDPTIRLADGGPGLRIHYRYHRNTLDMEEFMVERLAAVVREAGAREVLAQRSALPAGMFAGHHMGTVRMGADPLTSVADADGRAHDVPNLYLPGSGLFVTSAGVNPTLTIWALAYRSAAAIAREHGVPPRRPRIA